MNYNFNEETNRFNTGSVKWNVQKDELPMWIADMDFKTAPEIIEAIQNKANEGIFGYSDITDEWYDVYINWWKRRHNFEFKKEDLIFCTGIVPAISSIVRKMTCIAEKVVILTPTYNIFYNSIYNNGRYVVECFLKYENGSYEIDFDELEKSLSEPQVSLLLLCNPHNPTGTIWNKDTLKKIGELCIKNNVLVLSDEIHCDITAPDKKYIPFASVSEECKNNSITCISPTKAFNIAGLNSAAVVIPNPVIRHKVWRALNTDEAAEPNAFAVQAAIAAFKNGENWLNHLRAYIEENKQFAYSFINEKLPSLKPIKSEATYLLWIDCSAITSDSKDFCKNLRNKTGLYVNYGKEYGTNGEGFIRINLATTKERVKDGLLRLESYIKSI